MPRLLLWEKQDGLPPIVAAERYAKGIPGAKFMSFDECGHVPKIEKQKNFSPR